MPVIDDSSLVAAEGLKADDPRGQSLNILYDYFHI